jgi:hypothetical protein
LLAVVGIDIICVYILMTVSDSFVKLDSRLCALYTRIILHEESLFSLTKKGMAEIRVKMGLVPA